MTPRLGNEGRSRKRERQKRLDTADQQQHLACWAPQRNQAQMVTSRAVAAVEVRLRISHARRGTNRHTRTAGPQDHSRSQNQSSGQTTTTVPSKMLPEKQHKYHKPAAKGNLVVDAIPNCYCESCEIRKMLKTPRRPGRTHVGANTDGLVHRLDKNKTVGQQQPTERHTAQLTERDNDQADDKQTDTTNKTRTPEVTQPKITNWRQGPGHRPNKMTR